MSNIIIDEIKKEANHGIGQVIAEIFKSIVKPLLNLIDFVTRKITLKLEKRKIRKTKRFAQNSLLLRTFAERNRMDIIVLLSHNGKKSETGVCFKFISKLFATLDKNNPLLYLLLHEPSQIDDYDDWLIYCERGKDIWQEHFDNKLHSYFNEFGYKVICFRQYRTAFYLILCYEEPPKYIDELYITQQIDKLLMK